jgi:acetyl esterase
LPLQPEVARLLDSRGQNPGATGAGAANKQAVAKVEELAAGGSRPRVRIYSPDHDVEDGHALLVYLHGGGWVSGDLEMYDGTCRQLCRVTNAVIVSVDYRLAPTHPFPAGLDDCVSAVEWAASQAHVLSSDPDRLVLAGSSAGANLVAATALRVRDSGGPDIALQVLLYPPLDSSMVSGSYKRNGHGFLLEATSMASYWDQYLPDPAMRADPYASPSAASDLAGLPPALVVTAEYDPLRDEGEEYARRLLRSGVPVWCIRYQGQIHGFLAVGPDMADTLDVLDRIAEVVNLPSADRDGPRWHADIPQLHAPGGDL